MFLLGRDLFSDSSVSLGFKSPKEPTSNIIKHVRYFILSEESSSQMFYQIGVLKTFATFTEKERRRSLFLIKLQAFRFFLEYCEVFKNTFFHSTPPTPAQ